MNSNDVPLATYNSSIATIAQGYIPATPPLRAIISRSDYNELIGIRSNIRSQTPSLNTQCENSYQIRASTSYGLTNRDQSQNNGTSNHTITKKNNNNTESLNSRPSTTMTSTSRSSIVNDTVTSYHRSFQSSTKGPYTANITHLTYSKTVEKPLWPRVMKSTLNWKDRPTELQGGYGQPMTKNDVSNDAPTYFKRYEPTMDRHPHRRMIVNMKPKSEFESVLPGGSSLLRTIDVYKSNPKFHRNGDRHLNFQNQTLLMPVLTARDNKRIDWGTDD